MCIRASFWLAFIITMVFALALGMLIEICFLRPAKDPNVLGLIIITLGAEMLLMGLAGWKWGAEQKDFPFLLSVQKTHEVLPGLVLNEWSIGVFALTSVIMVLLFLFFRYSRLGIARRATQQNVNAAKIMGIKVERVFSITWAMSSLIGAIAAMFLSLIHI